MAGFSPAAAILENAKTLGTRLQPTDAQGTHLKQLQLTGLPWLNMLLLLLLLLLLWYALWKDELKRGGEGEADKKRENVFK